MKKESDFILRYLSAFVLILIYLITVVIHLVSDSFIPEDQIALFLIMVPFILFGTILDFILNRNQTIPAGYRILAKLMPAGVFIMQLISTLLLYQDIDTFAVFKYLIWIFLSLPLFIASYNKDGLRPRIMHSVIGLAAVLAVYLFLTTQTDKLNVGIGAVIYFFTYFFLIFTASGVKKMPYLGTLLGILNAVVLLAMRYVTVSETSKTFGWDYHFINKNELLVIITLILSIIIRLIEIFQPKSLHQEKLS